MHPRRVYLVRHGQTDWNLLKLWQGHGGPGLNEAGRIQAEAAASKLRNLGIASLVSSDLPRAVETAEFVSKATGLKIILDPALRERDAGRWTGKTMDQIVEANPGTDLVAGLLGPRDLDGIENWEAFTGRVLNSFIRHLSEERGNTAFVTHGGAIFVILSHINPGDDYSVPENGSITVIEEEGEFRVLKTVEK